MRQLLVNLSLTGLFPSFRTQPGAQIPPHTACSRDGKPPGPNANGTAPPYRPNTPTRLQLIPLHTGPGSL